VYEKISGSKMSQDKRHLKAGEAAALPSQKHSRLVKFFGCHDPVHNLNFRVVSPYTKASAGFVKQMNRSSFAVGCFFSEMNARMRSECRRCLFLPSLFAAFCLSAMLSTSARAAEAVAGDIVLPAEVSRANFRGETGTEVGLYRSAESAQWVMTVTESEGRPVTILLEGQPSALKPTSLDYTTDFDGQPMGMMADRSQLYVRGTYEGRTLECVRDAKGARTTLDGKRSAEGVATPGEMESVMMLDEVAGRWEIMRQTVVSVDTNGLAMWGSADPASRPRHFTRTGILSEDESKRMEERLAAHETIQDESKTFLTREQKLEETP
jgi:hypothetical protein